MNIINLELAHDFKGETVVLLAMNNEGIEKVLLSLQQPIDHETALFQCTGNKQVFVFDSNEDSFKFENDDSIIWKITQIKREEIIQKISILIGAEYPCHHYVEIQAPVDTLVLSKNEYV